MRIQKCMRSMKCPLITFKNITFKYIIIYSYIGSSAPEKYRQKRMDTWMNNNLFNTGIRPANLHWHSLLQT